MGNLCGSQGAPRGNPEQEQKNKDIDGEIRKDKARLDTEIKLLLLGAGESGKSTIAKQMRIIHLDGFSPEERDSYKSIIASNTLGSMRVLITAASDMGIELQPQNKEAASNILSDNAGFHGTVSPAIARDIKLLWGDEAIRQVFGRSSEFQLNDSAGYYFDAIERIAQPDYNPTEQDVLRSRTKTTGIIETEFAVEGVLFRMVDVGGQRSERKKWMYCFQDVTAVIFCVAMSEYDLKLYEDDTTNRMHESLKLFKEISNTKWFVNTAMILFLNKSDLFREKIKKIDLTTAFPDYSGGKSYENASEYIKKAFLSQPENPKKAVYSHFTCATDTQNVTIVFNAVKDIILNNTLNEAGIGL